MPVFLGTSGWQYDDWRGRFYPQELSVTKWLEHYSEHFDVVEVNNTFYRLPKRETFEAWSHRTPPGFCFVVKVSRYLTHIKRLKEPQESVAKFIDHARWLGDKLGPLLVQLPPYLQADPERLRETLEAFRGFRVAVEFRHESWFTEKIRSILEENSAAWVLADRGESPVGPVWRTADWTLLRFHQGSSTPHPCYRRATLAQWGDHLSQRWSNDEDVFVFFNNDHLCCAVRDAIHFAREVRDRGFVTSSVPSRSEVKVG